MKVISFRVYGIAKPGGSKKAINLPGVKYTVLVDMCKDVGKWRSTVAKAAKIAFMNQKPFTGPIKLEIVFYMPRRRFHFGSGRNADMLKGSAPEHHVIRPDCTKLLRSTEDALIKIAWHDDSQVIDQHARKMYHNEPGAFISIEEITSP